LIHSYVQQQISFQLSKVNVAKGAWDYLKALFQQSKHALGYQVYRWM